MDVSLVFQLEKTKMNSNQTYDFIIAGAGAAGLSLLWHFLHSSLKYQKLLLIDNSFDIINDKTWCFWSSNHPFSSMAYHSWSELEVISDGNVYSEQLSSYQYHCIRNGDYRNKILELSRQFKNVDLLESNVFGFESRADMAVVQTEEGEFHGRWIFQSVMNSPQVEQSVSDISLIQHFVGWEIEVQDKKNYFSPSKATLMDFDTPQQKGLTFFYVLPFTHWRALVEYTIFSESTMKQEQYEKVIGTYIKERFHLSDSCYRIVRKEKGAIPMDDREVPGYFNNRTLNIGTVGGTTKPTTGYTFTRAHHHSREIVDALTAGKAPKPFSGSKNRFKVYDMMLLYLLRNEQKNSRKIFHDLFDKNSIDRILQFLAEETHFFQEIAIFSKLPYPPFFRSIYQMKHRILSLRNSI